MTPQAINRNGRGTWTLQIKVWKIAAARSILPVLIFWMLVERQDAKKCCAIKFFQKSRRFSRPFMHSLVLQTLDREAQAGINPGLMKDYVFTIIKFLPSPCPCFWRPHCITCLPITNTAKHRMESASALSQDAVIDLLNDPFKNGRAHLSLSHLRKADTDAAPGSFFNWQRGHSLHASATQDI